MLKSEILQKHIEKCEKLKAEAAELNAGFVRQMNTLIKKANLLTAYPVELIPDPMVANQLIWVYDSLERQKVAAEKSEAQMAKWSERWIIPALPVPYSESLPMEKKVEILTTLAEKMIPTRISDGKPHPALSKFVIDSDSRTVHHLAVRCWQEICKYRGMGRDSVQLLEAALLKNGLRLSMEIPSDVAERSRALIESQN